MDRSEFDPTLHAFYYARMLEISTPRWTTIQAHELDRPARRRGRDRAGTRLELRRSGTRRARKRARALPGVTVADVVKKGGVALTDAQLKALIVGKSIWLRNTVTGEQFKVVYDSGGQAIVFHATRGTPQPSAVGEVAENSYLGNSQAYWICNAASSRRWRTRLSR